MWLITLNAEFKKKDMFEHHLKWMLDLDATKKL